MNIIIDGIPFDSPKGWTILEAAKFLGLEIPTLCHNEGLTPWGGCRLCVVETGTGGNSKLVSSCTYPVEEGLQVKTSSARVLRARKMILELLIAQCPTSKVLQDLAAKIGLNRIRFTPKWENCIYCGLCVRMCEEQMMAKAIGFINIGNRLKIDTPFDMTSEECRRCGGCIYICPTCTTRCEGPAAENVLCGRCENTLQPTCTELNDNYNCWMGLTGSCGTCVQEKT
ncbi:MAG: (2Fe-2S)-binding protein [Bacteroidetes bacterium]|nr:(2Fe-2S)-binding protein [Bacteroidota bacterium]